MKLLVGLGNPGEKYQQTRHNVGWNLVEILNSKLQILNNDQSQKFQVQSRFEADVIKFPQIILAKPQTFMNESGRSVQKISSYYHIQTEDIYVFHDDLDIELGKYKIEFARGPKVHNGVNSVEQSLNTKDFWRVRIGVDNRTSEQRAHISGRDYVLMKLNKEEMEILNSSFEQIINELLETINR